MSRRAPTPAPLTPGELADLTAPWRAAARAELEERAVRDRLIVRALSEGMSQRVVATMVGVSHGLPPQVAKRAGA